jgi:DNA gyrase/topoisomerase IV subunit A
MARRYCGSNNINLLQPDGQFGSRHSNHAGAARYISAGDKLSQLNR